MSDIYYHEYNLSVTSENAIPPDVLVEHLAVALRSLNFTGKIGITMNSTTVHGSGKTTWDHPFDGPEVFDDDPKPVKFAEGGYTGSMWQEGEFTVVSQPTDPYPLTTEAAMQLKEARDEQRRRA